MPRGIFMQVKRIPSSIFAERLSSLLERAGENQVSLSHKKRLKQANLSRYLNGRIPKADILAKLAEFFGVSVDDLIAHSAQNASSKYNTSVTFAPPSNLSPVRDLPPSKKVKIVELEEAIEALKKSQKAMGEGITALEKFANRLKKG